MNECKIWNWKSLSTKVPFFAFGVALPCITSSIFLRNVALVVEKVNVNLPSLSLQLIFVYSSFLVASQ